MIFDSYIECIKFIRKIKSEHKIKSIVIKPDNIGLLATFIENHQFTKKLCDNIAYDIGGINDPI